MEFPGEQLVRTMWASLVDKGIGNLLRPSQIRREGRAQAEVRTEEMLRIAQAERDADDIRSGRKSLYVDGKVPRLVTNSNSVEPSLPKLTTREGSLSLEMLPVTIESAHYSDLLRREINVAKSIQHAQDDLSLSTDAVPDGQPDADWLYRWRDYAGEVSTEQLQAMWGRLLSGEVKQPGAYSLRTLEFLRNASIHEAELVAKAAPFVTGRIICKNDEVLKRHGMSFEEFLQQEELGLLSGSSGVIGMHMRSTEPDCFVCYISGRTKALQFVGKDIGHSLAVPSYTVSKLGQQIFALCEAETNDAFLRDVAVHLKGDLRVALCTVTQGKGSYYHIVHSEDIT